MNLSTYEREQLRQSGFEIRHEIGRGTSGVVYLAHQPLLDRDVALKRVGIDAASEDSSPLRLEREVSALVSLEHPGVVRLMDVQRYENSIWFVMEHVDGPTLRTVLDLSPDGLDPSDALEVIEALASVLEYISEMGIVHRDLKPANVFLTKDGRCKVGDFGIALLNGPRDQATGEVGVPGRLTAPGVVVGTPAYLSPEQVTGSSKITSASDLYALGVMTYELFVGRVPFTSGGNVLALLLAQQGDDPPEPRSIRPELTIAVQDALLAPLAKRPEQRPASPLAFWSNLEAAADQAWPGWESRSDLASLSGRLAPSRSVRSEVAQTRSDRSVSLTGTSESAVDVPEHNGEHDAHGHLSHLRHVTGTSKPFDPVSVRPARRGIAWRRWILLLLIFVVVLAAAFFAARALSTRRSGGPGVGAMVDRGVPGVPVVRSSPTFSWPPAPNAKDPSSCQPDADSRRDPKPFMAGRWNTA